MLVSEINKHAVVARSRYHPLSRGSINANLSIMSPEFRIDRFFFSEVAHEVFGRCRAKRPCNCAMIRLSARSVSVLMAWRKMRRALRWLMIGGALGGA